MHYYKRNLGDYAKKCGRLTMLQHGAYTLLIDACYDREIFPTLREAIDWTWASSKEEIEAVEFVLGRFFDLENDVFIQKRIIEELEQYHATAKTNKRIAAEREAKRKEIITDGTRIVHASSPSVNEAPPNHKPLTINHKPSNSRFGDFWNAWPTSERKQDKAKCAAKWKADKLDDLTDLILSDIAVKRRTEKWQGGYIEAPLVYLNNRRWEDGVQPQSAAPVGLSDPDSRAAIEAEGVAMGIGPWSEITEQWPSYKARVRGKPAPALNISQLTDMAKRRIA